MFLDEKRNVEHSRSNPEKTSREIEESKEYILTKKNRPRSVRTKRKNGNEIPIDVSIEKILEEKETQCALSKEETQKDVLINLNDSIKTLHLLLSEVQSQSCKFFASF